jgi:hypothetical protein
MGFFLKGLNSFKIQTKYKFSLFTEFLIQATMGI